MKKIHKYAIYCFAVLLASVAGSVALCNNKRPHDSDFINCVATTRILKDKADAGVSIRVKLDKKGQGVMVFHGTLQKPEGKIYHIARQISMTYKKSTDSAIVVQHTATQKDLSDNVPEELFNLIVWDNTKDTTKLYVKRMDNGYFFLNYFSPIMICVSKPGL